MGTARKVDPLIIGGAGNDTPGDAAASTEEAKEASAVLVQPKPKLVRIHFPKPTDISLLAASVARWSGRSFVIPEGVGGRVAIHSPGLLLPEEAYSIFLAALGSIGLRVVEQGAASKILPLRLPHYT